MSAARPSQRDWLKAAARGALPRPVYRRLMAGWRQARRAAQPVRWGNLRRRTAVSWYGFDRGTPIDRFYIEAFLQAHAADIRGRVLEIESDAYTRRFGNTRVHRRDVLHTDAGHPGATLIGDLATGQGVPTGVFDCIILTQTLQFIYDIRGAVRNTLLALRPGGVLLATVPGITRLSQPDLERWGEYWHLTSLSTRRLLEEVFPPESVSVSPQGSLISAVAFLYGLAAEDLTRDELGYRDAEYEVLIAARAVRPLG